MDLPSTNCAQESNQTTDLKMKENPENRDEKIEKFLKCEDELKKLAIDENVLANQIKSRARVSRLFSIVISFSLPLAACLATIYLWHNHTNDNHADFESLQVVNSTEVQSENLSGKISEVEVLDDWLIASEGLTNITLANYESSYELLLSLETISLP